MKRTKVPALALQAGSIAKNDGAVNLSDEPLPDHTREVINPLRSKSLHAKKVRK